MGDKIVKSKNLCCQPVVFPSLSLLTIFLILGCNATGTAGYWSEYDMCTCKANIVGDRCDKCTEGFSGFPSCTAGKFFFYDIA